MPFIKLYKRRQLTIFTETNIMFGLFKKKEPVAPVNDVVFMNTEAKHRHLLSLASLNAEQVFVCWFEQTAETLQQFFEANGLSRFTIILPRELAAHRNVQPVFCEHHPSFKIEQQRFLQLGLSQVTVVSSLDEGLMKKFGGERIAVMMKNLGMKEDEPVSHKMITRSIQNAQKKIDKTFNGTDLHVRSQEEWLKRAGGY